MVSLILLVAMIGATVLTVHSGVPVISWACQDGTR